MRLIDKIVEATAVLAFAVSSLLILLNVFNRYVIFDWMRNLAKTWPDFDPVYLFFRDVLGSWSVMADEVPGLLLVWIAFLGAYLMMRNNGHIAFDMIIEAIPGKFSRTLKLLNFLLLGGFMIILLWQSVRMIQVSGRTEIETAEIAQGWFMIILPLAALLFLTAISIHAIKLISPKKN